MITTLLTHIYNEEYLLPFWLNHHKDMFDNIIIIDYRSTDKSLEICKNICPDCKIITTRNMYFEATEIDKEVMDIEKDIKGVKVVLNTTEFLFTEKPIKDIFSSVNEPVSFSVNCYCPYSKKQYTVNNKDELFSNLFNDDVVFHRDRNTRQVHNFIHGNYGMGRHFTGNPCIVPNNMHIIWFGFYPLNDDLLKRKLQIKTNIPQSDKNLGRGAEHLYTLEKMLEINNNKAETGVSLDKINSSLYGILAPTYKNKHSLV